MLIIQGHEVSSHHHDEELGANVIHHHDESNHNSFSLADLDEEFTLKGKTEITFGPPAALLPVRLGIFVPEPESVELMLVQNEFPPPRPFLQSGILRAPPLSFC